VPKSRHQALHAGLNILRAQRRIYVELNIQPSRDFLHFFSNFDTAVLVAAIYALYPKESPRHSFEALQNVELCIHGFKALGSMNNLVRAAISVLQALCERIKKRTTPQGLMAANANLRAMARGEQNNLTPGDAHPRGNIPGDAPPAFKEILRIHSGGSQELYPPSSGPFFQQTGLQESSLECASIIPLFPIRDLLTNNLSGIHAPPSNPSLSQGGQQYDSLADWQFQGHFQDDTFWSLMNQAEFY